MPNNRYYSGSSGLWTTLTNWDNYPTLGYPASDDVVYANNKTVTIDTGITANLLTTALTPVGGGLAGGGFLISTNTGMTITTNISAGTSTCLTTSNNQGTTTLIGNVSGGTTTPAHGVTHSGLGNLVISGNVNGGRFATVYGVNITSTVGINLSACPSVYVIGNVSGGTNITATPGIFSTALCLVDITGDCVAGTQFPAVSLSNQSALLIVRGNLISTTGSSISVSPYYGFNLKCSPTANQNYIFQDTSATSANTTFSTSAYTYGIPSTSDVRSGVKYGYLSGLTGTMIIPPFSAVSVGIPVDNGSGGVTYGTAITGIRDIGNMLGGYIG
jgi:hypothetical protein